MKQKQKENLTNDLGQPIGWPVENWSPRLRPDGRPLIGQYCRLERLQTARHGDDLFEAYAAEASSADWTYLPEGPFASRTAFVEWVERMASRDDLLCYAILTPRGDGRDFGAAGMASLMRIDPANGCIEVGHILYSPRLQRRPAATEAMFVLMRHVFEDLGYRRYEWKCDALNERSRRAALRLGFEFEGIFRQAVVYRGRNRDTAWFSITDQEWPLHRAALTAWLSDDNFDADGRQRQSLVAMRSRLAAESASPLSR